VLKQDPSQAITTRFFRPSADAAPYISSYYLIDFAIGADEVVSDWLHPEWGNIRFAQDDRWSIGLDKQFQPLPPQVGTGPTSHTVAFRVQGPTRIWGVGILPRGWLRLIDVPANSLADTTVECTPDSAFASFVGLREAVFAMKPDPVAQAARIDGFIRELLAKRPPNEEEARIRNIHAALFNDNIRSVGDLAASIKISSRSLERVALRAFGFPPKLLMRRQRFLRSVSQFLLDPSLSWIDALDADYVDQAHFVRDFKKFMRMSPSAYAALDHPVLRSATRIRTATAGAPVQALHRPDQPA
jgi:AraC-like DNA-binding protein